MSRALLIALALALPSCGGEARPAEPASSRVAEPAPGDRSSPERTIRSYFAGFERGDPELTCGQLTEEVREEVAKRAGATDCVAAMTVVLRPMHASIRAATADIGKLVVDAQGERAQVRPARRPEFAPEGPLRSFELTRDSSGEWRIAALPPQGSVQPSEYAECVAGVFKSQVADAAPYWRRQPAEKVFDYSRRACQVARRRGMLPLKDASRRKIGLLAYEVLFDMVRDGDLPRPRGRKDLLLD